jgi:hypothetical protein
MPADDIDLKLCPTHHAARMSRTSTEDMEMDTLRKNQQGRLVGHGNKILAMAGSYALKNDEWWAITK